MTNPKLVAFKQSIEATREQYAQVDIFKRRIGKTLIGASLCAASFVGFISVVDYYDYHDSIKEQECQNLDTAKILNCYQSSYGNILNEPEDFLLIFGIGSLSLAGISGTLAIGTYMDRRILHDGKSNQGQLT
jgi:hypothetical protein